MEKTFPPRLHVLLASEKPYGVVIRRGPSKRVCFIGWDREKDEFMPTQWLKGRIYERRSDLSSDGKYLIYFAMNGRWDSEAKGAWTAISQSPWMKAKVLFAKGDCWHGGGLFLDDKTYWLNDGCGHEILQQTNEVKQDTSFQPKENFGGECPGVYYLRLQRDGWILKQYKKKGQWNDIVIFEKLLPKGWIIRKIAHAEVGSPEGKGCYWDEHELIDKNNKVQQFPDWEWAELDRNRLVWATNGCLYSCSIKSENQLDLSQLLYDFNDMKFQRVKAPY